ncbi:transposable element Tc1 transposase [Elysia marginata]|uniref:Transposable element Tc1 transposase n=1 Tax=Elysia marginata TaxID=1093978 RepID=A0AAV4JAH8_9GAST|nr:transposable element Tc1 transposase [Elysia marginata]
MTFLIFAPMHAIKKVWTAPSRSSYHKSFPPYECKQDNYFQTQTTSIILYETDTVSDRSRSGRPRCTTQRQDRNLVRNHMNNRFLSAPASSRQTRGRNNQRISANTGRRRLSSSGLRARRPYIGPILTWRHRHQRTLWAQEHAAWDRIQWRSVVFSDESRFCIDYADGRVGI